MSQNMAVSMKWTAWDWSQYTISQISIQQLQPPKERHTEGKEIRGGVSMRKLKEILRAVALWRFKSVTVVWEMPNRARVAHNKDGPKWHQGARRSQAELAIPRTQLPLSCNSQRRSECFGSPGRDEKRLKEFGKRWETRCCGHFERKWRSS